MAPGETVEAVMKGGGMVHDCALFALESLVLHNSARIDWYNYRSGDAPLKTGTRSTSRGAIVMHNSSYINGDVVVGAGGDPGDVIDGSGTYAGSAYAQSVSHETPAVSVPAGLVSSPSGNAIDRNQTISTSGKYSKIDLGKSEILTINGRVELYITGNVTLGNSAEIRVNEGCSLVLYVDGNVAGNNSSKFNNKTRDAKCLKLLGTGSCSQITLNNSGDMYAIVYAPSADLVVHNSATVRGSVTVRACELKNSAVMYYDASLREHQDPAFTGSLELASWREY